MKIYYVNHRNEIIDLNSDDIVLQYHEFYDYSWDANTSNSKIISFSRTSSTIPVTVTICPDTWESFIEISERFHNVIETDIVNRIPGKLYVGEYYLKCYISGDKKTDAFMGVPIQVKNLTIVTDYSHWVHEDMYSFKTTDITSSNNKLYPYKYAYRYANGLSSTSIVNANFKECNFKMIIYGPVTKPQVIIGGYKYFIDIILEDGEYLEIDSVENTVTKVMATGIRVNCFHNRSKSNSVFRPIQTGRQDISWSGKFDFDIVILQERSEPRW